MHTQFICQPGMTVYGSDGEKVGTIQEIFGDYVVVEKGFFFPKDYYIPTSAIASGAGDDVYLNVTKDEALHQGWDMVPETETISTGTAYAGRGDRAAEVIAPDYTAATDATDVAASRDAVRVPVYEEEITPVKRQVDRGKVRIEKELVTEDRTVTVPVTEERVRVSRVASDAAAPVGAIDAAEDRVIEVPVRGEEVDLQRTARKTGEVVVEKEAVARDEQVGGKVRREEVRVDDQTIPTDAAEFDERDTPR